MSQDVLAAALAARAARRAVTAHCAAFDAAKLGPLSEFEVVRDHHAHLQYLSDCADYDLWEAIEAMP